MNLTFGIFLVTALFAVVFVNGASFYNCEVGFKQLIDVPTIRNGGNGCLPGYAKVRGVCRRVYKTQRPKRSPEDENDDPCERCVEGYHVINGKCVFVFD